MDDRDFHANKTRQYLEIRKLMAGIYSEKERLNQQIWLFFFPELKHQLQHLHAWRSW